MKQCRRKAGFRACMLIILCLCNLSLRAQTQYTVKGELIDSVTNKGTEYATIAILNSEQKPVASGISDMKGKFSLKVKETGNYTLTIASIGYMPIEKKITVTEKTTDLGQILFIPGVEIESVTVATTRPLIRSDIDKIAYSVEDDPETPTSTALDILRKVPLISVDGDDNIYLQGQSNYKVLMNGKSSSLLSSNFKDMMKSMPASSIKDIEVITNPSSKYEAEGVGGIINIITNRRNDIGYNGNIGFNANTMGGYGGYGYITGKIGKFTLSANAYLGHFEQSGIDSYSEQLYKLRDSLVRTTGENKFKGRHMNFQLESSYEIDTFNLITLSLWQYGGKFDSNYFSETRGQKGDGPIVQGYDNHLFNRNKHNGLSGNLDYQRTFMKPDRTFTVSYKLDYNPQKQTSENQISEFLNYTPYWQLSENDAHSYEHTFQVDFAEPITPKHFIEVGAKYILRINDSEPETYRKYAENDNWILDPRFQNDLDYDQHIFGAYTGYTFKVNPKLSFKAGARMEGTWNDGKFTTQKGETKFDNSFFDVVPYATISYAPNMTSRTSLSYTQRLSRPGIWYLNPYLNDSDPNSWSQGNPNLDTEVSHQFNLSYGIFTAVHTLNLTASAVIVNNSIERITKILPEYPDVLYNTYENIGHRNNYGVNAYYSFRKGAKFSINVNSGVNYMDISNGDGLKNDGWQYNASGNTRIGLWKDAAFNAYGGYYSSNISLQGKRQGFYYYGMGFTQGFLKQKLNFSVNAQNPFTKRQKYWSETDTPDLYQYSEQWNKRRSVNFSLSYRFGKMNVQVKKAKRGIRNDDLKAGESGSAGGGGGQ